MKKIIIFAVAVATLFAFSSCQKENLQDNGTTNGVRIITAEFENNATKTNLNSDGVTPEWKLGDKIMLLNNSGQQEIEIISGSDTPPDGKAYIINGTGLKISTHLDNTLYAVYPASATTMTSCIGNITFTIPTLQDGTFASANICVAKSMADDETNKDNLVFSNATAVLKFEQLTSTGVLGIDIKATNAIAGQVSVTFNTDGTINNLDISSLSSKTIYMASESAKAEYYVAVGTVTSGNTKIVYLKDKGTSSESKDSKELARNVIYSLGSMDGKSFDTSDKNGQRGILNGHEYVMFKAKYNGSTETYRKWALMNIGATAPTDNGWYFSWGNTTGYVHDATNKWVKASDNMTKLGTDGSFSETNYNDTDVSGNGNSLSANIPVGVANDAAYANWGSSWKMPSINDFIAMCKAGFSEWTNDYDGTRKAGVIVWEAKGTGENTDAGWYKIVTAGKGRKIKDEGTFYSPEDHTFTNTYSPGTDAHVFFPAADIAFNTEFQTEYSDYWSNTYDSGKALTLLFKSGDANAHNSSFRYFGLPVRPIAVESVSD